MKKLIILLTATVFLFSCKKQEDDIKNTSSMVIILTKEAGAGSYTYKYTALGTAFYTSSNGNIEENRNAFTAYTNKDNMDSGISYYAPFSQQDSLINH